MSIYSTGINPLIQTIINTSNSLSSYTSISSNNIANNIINTSNILNQNILNTSNYIKNVNNALSYDITFIKGDISGINSAISTIEGEITTLQGEITANTADIITANTAIVANGVITTANTVAIAGNTIAIASCLTNSMVQSGNIGLFYAGTSLNVVYNSTHFYDAAVLGTNRELTLTSTYANLPTTKNNVITWNTPLQYNTGTNTASIDLSSYFTRAQTDTVIKSSNQFYISSNTVANVYLSSNTLLNNIIPNYVTNRTLSNQFYISSNTVANVYLSSNTLLNNIIPNYVTYTALSNQLYISSNAVANVYLSSNTLLNNIIPNYVTYTALSNQFYISSNTVANVYLSSNTLLNNIIPNYVTYTALSNQLYISSNTVANVYLSSNTLLNNVIPNYVTYTALSNQLYISSNTVANVYLSSNTLLNNIIPNYVTYTALSNQLYISSNTVGNVYLSSNSFFNYLIPNYVTNTGLSNQFNISSNTVASLYVSSNSFFNYLIPNYVTTSNFDTTIGNINNVDYLAYTNERQYPPKVYDSSTSETTTTFLSKTIYFETIRINSYSYGYGTYNIYSSSAFGTLNKKSLFNFNTTETTTTSFGATSYTSGVYNGTNFIKSDYLGDWIIIKLPNPIVLTNFSFYPRTTANTRVPAEWKCYGSVDGVNFNEITEGNNSTRLTPTNYSLGYYNKVLASTFTTPYLYIGWCVNKLVTTTDVFLNFSELQIFGKELLNPIYYYTSSNINSINTYIINNSNTNVISMNSTSNYIKNLSVIVQNNSNTNVISMNNTSNYINNISIANTNTYISSNNFYKGSNLVFDKSVQILTGSSYPYPYNDILKNALVVGDGGRLLINQEGTGNPYARTMIGTSDLSSSGNVSSNSSISLFEAGFITYNANISSGWGHNFNGSVQTNNLYVNGTINASGPITSSFVTASNIGVKTPITFTTSRTITSGGDTYYLYDIDLRKYTKQINLGSYNYRQFRARTWEADGNFENSGFLSQNRYEIFMSDYNGLSIRSYSYYDNQALDTLNVILSHTLLRNSFNFMSYASRLAPATVYMIIEDLL